MRIILTFLLFLAYANVAICQIGGDNVFEFVNLPLSARTSALGGNLMSVQDQDASLGFTNPSLLNPRMHQDISFNTSLHFAGISYGYAGYAHYVDRWKMTLNGGVQFISYGNFTSADETGVILGEFSASEVALGFGAGYQYSERLTFGLNAKLLYSSLESYNSTGIGADLGVTYSDTARNFSASLVFRNIGTQIGLYTPGNREPYPFDVQAGFSKKLSYLPLRISITAHNLHRWNIRYDDPNVVESTPLFGDSPGTESDFAVFVDNLFRHLVFSGELLIGKNEVMQLRFGYNHLRRKELTVNNTRGLAGFSGGFGFKIRRFRIGYGLAVYHLAGTTNSFSISTSIGEFKR